MQRTRRGFLYGGLLAAAATAGCPERDGGNGNGDGRVDPTAAIIEQPRIDVPPYTIVEQPDDADDWNQLYLCENMPPGTYLDFQTISAPRLTDPLLPSEDPRGDEYAMRVLTSADAVHEVFETGESGASDETEGTEASAGDGTGGTEDPGGDATPTADGPEDGPSEGDGTAETPIAETDFEENVIVVVESGYVSGSMAHHWERVRTNERGFRLQGCYVVPYERTDDATTQHSVVRVERPDDFELARVSLTTREDERVHVNSTEGIVSVEKDV